jgi:hypothetical protein
LVRVLLEYFESLKHPSMCLDIESPELPTEARGDDSW